MNGYLLDTNICIYLLRDKYGIAEKLDALGDVRLCVSEITLAELYYGASKSGRKEEKLNDVRVISEMFEVLPISDILEEYGECRYILESCGMRLDDFDLLIGTTAVANELIVVTENVKHLERIPNVVIENWVN